MTKHLSILRALLFVLVHATRHASAADATPSPSV